MATFQPQFHGLSQQQQQQGEHVPSYAVHTRASLQAVRPKSNPRSRSPRRSDGQLLSSSMHQSGG
jgi:hypothetical protein